MTQALLFSLGDLSMPREISNDVDKIAELLARRRVRFEHRLVGSCPVLTDSSRRIPDVYREEVTGLVAQHGYKSADVVSLSPQHAARLELRAKFRAEHRHAEDEVRLFVDGLGAFYLRFDDGVVAVLCGRGDLIAVPAGQRHWFDFGAEPRFVAIRLFSNPDYWRAEYTGDPIVDSVPSFESLLEFVADHHERRRVRVRVDVDDTASRTRR